MLAVSNLEVVYDDLVHVLRGVTLTVRPGQIVALLGANGAGKSTLLRALSGVLSIHDGKVTSGSMSLDGLDVRGHDATRLVRAGVVQVPEGRRILAELTVEENLRIGGHTRPAGRADSLERVLGLFPVLRKRLRSTAGYLSGGEQQMLAMGRALMADPRYLLLDEPSLGLAPRVVAQVRDLVAEINASGVGVLLVEQNAAMALSIASHGYVLENGRMVMDNNAASLIADADIREFYLGRLDEDDAGSLRTVKYYRRRKRWLS